MINKVIKLNDKLINQIAAGEVVDNPASVIKELIENSIDAKSKNIKIFIEDGGKKSILILDDGHGMHKEDLLNAFERFATSKIESEEDLENINTLGFRGEALPSISSVSKITIKSKNDSNDGHLLEIDGGKITDSKPNSITKGTSIHVKNLFFNVPARLKFLKKDTIEYQKILVLFKVFALSNPKISFSLFNEKKEIYNLPSSNLKSRIINIYGIDYKDSLIEVDFIQDEFKVSGYIGNLSLVKKRRGNQFTFINGRYILNTLINQTVYNSYDSLISRGEFPFFLLNFSLNNSFIDINVHPKKTEIKFKNELQIQHIVKKSVVKSLKNKIEVIPNLYTPKENYNSQIIDLPFNESNRSTNNVSKETVDKMFVDNNLSLSNDMKVWQIHNKYILTEISSGLIVIDQHVAHERILYEMAKKSLDGKGLNSQKLMFPITINYTPEDFNSLLDILPYLNKIGFDIREFGNNSVIIEGSPPELTNGKEKDVIDDILDNFIEHKQLNSSFIDYMAATYSCKAAIKAGDKLDESECVNLIDKLFSTKHPYYCPHGRPIIINLSINDLDKRFERL
tara:strand:- start:14753 stop:16453 length:1701 start_codon:yes stop_codon:yes gene_type:complete